MFDDFDHANIVLEGSGLNEIPAHCSKFFPNLLSLLCEALGKRNHTPRCSSEELFFAEKNGGHRGKISVVDMVSLVFIGFLYPPLAWKLSL